MILKRINWRLLKDATSFLNLDSSFLPEKSFLNSTPQKVNYSIPRIKFLIHKNRFQYEYNQTNTRFFPKNQTALDKALCFGFDLVDRCILSWIYPNHSHKMNEDTMALLSALYLSDIIKLEDLLKTNLDHWK